MTPEQFKHCRKNILRLEQDKLADMLGLHFRQVHRYERGITPIPPRITYAMAWIALHGTRNPWRREDDPSSLIEGSGERAKVVAAPMASGRPNFGI